MLMIRKSKHLITWLIFTIILLVLIEYNILDVSLLINDSSSSTHFNLITVNAVFAGFLFSSLTFLVGINETNTIETLERINYMDNVYQNIILGLVSSLLSIVISLVCIFIVPNLLNLSIVKLSMINYLIKTLIPVSVIVTMTITIVGFLKATWHISFIISSIRRKARKKFPDKESIQKTLDSIK